MDVLEEGIKILNNIPMRVISWLGRILNSIWGHSIPVFGEAPVADDTDDLDE